MEPEVIDTDTIDYEKYTIHVVDDSPLMVTALLNVLQPKRYKVTSSTNGKNALESITKDIPDIIILDVEMPVMDGYETIQHLKKNKKTANIPVIFLTSLNKPDIIKKIFDLGASDYISKPFVEEEILARIKKEIKNIMLQDMLKEKMSKLAELLSIDKLTRVSNQIHMTSLINTSLEKIKVEKKGSFSLMYIDIDSFNYFVKKHGIALSDIALKKIAMIIKRSIRDKDKLARWNGDTFIILFQNIKEDELDVIAKSIRDNIAQTPFDSDKHLTCSISTLEITKDLNISNIIKKLQNSMQSLKKTQKSSIIKIID